MHPYTSPLHIIQHTHTHTPTHTLNRWVDPLVLEAVDALNGDKSKAAELESIFSQAANNSFNTMRLFLTGPSERLPLQTSPGIYGKYIYVYISHTPWQTNTTPTHH